MVIEEFLRPLSTYLDIEKEYTKLKKKAGNLKNFPLFY
jgi:hypothetical protein